MATKLFDSTLLSTAEQALDFIGNILESSSDSGRTRHHPRVGVTFPPRLG